MLIDRSYVHKKSVSNQFLAIDFNQIFIQNLVTLKSFWSIIVRNIPLVLFIDVFFSLTSHSGSFSRNFFNFSFIYSFDILNCHTLTTKAFVSYFIVLICYLYCLLSENLSRFPQILASIKSNY